MTVVVQRNRTPSEAHCSNSMGVQSPSVVCRRRAQKERSIGGRTASIIGLEGPSRPRAILSTTMYASIRARASSPRVVHAQGLRMRSR
jgi:hypothetical protein